jgi:hypothetical protein
MKCIIYNIFKYQVSLWSAENNSDKFEPRIICESENLDGEVTELKVFY